MKNYYLLFYLLLFLVDEGLKFIFLIIAAASEGNYICFAEFSATRVLKFNNFRKLCN